MKVLFKKFVKFVNKLVLKVLLWHYETSAEYHYTNYMMTGNKHDKQLEKYYLKKYARVQEKLREVE